MDYINFKGANSMFGAPADWKPAVNGECGSLPVQIYYDGATVPHMKSCWKPTLAELDALRNGAAVCITIHAFEHPPIGMLVQHVEEQPMPLTPPVTL